MSSCSRCGEPVVRPAGTVLLLEVDEHRCGIYRPDGTKLRPSEIVAGQIGHRLHECAPQAAARQLDLWSDR